MKSDRKPQPNIRVNAHLMKLEHGLLIPHWPYVLKITLKNPNPNYLEVWLLVKYLVSQQDIESYQLRNLGQGQQSRLYNNNNNNNNNSQCGSRFRGVWGDPTVGNLTPTGITTHREVDSLRPTKPFFFLKKVYKEDDYKPKTKEYKRGRGGAKINKEQRHTSTTQGRKMPSPPKSRLYNT